MKHYRIYKLRGQQGPIMKGKDVLAASDGDAMRDAAADDDCPVCEVWNGTRKVGSVD